MRIQHNETRAFGTVRALSADGSMAVVRWDRYMTNTKNVPMRECTVVDPSPIDPPPAPVAAEEEGPPAGWCEV